MAVVPSFSSTCWLLTVWQNGNLNYVALILQLFFFITGNGNAMHSKYFIAVNLGMHLKGKSESVEYEKMGKKAVEINKSIFVGPYLYCSICENVFGRHLQDLFVFTEQRQLSRHPLALLALTWGGTRQ